jgi:multiple antibiotic resistance protein
MPIDVNNFIHHVFIGFIALFPVINPLGTAFIVSPYFTGLTDKERRNAVKKVALYSFILCLVVLLTGHWILELFGLTVPIVQLGGGIVICKIGWDFLNSNEKDKKQVTIKKSNSMDDETIESKLFFPITFPITAGAGAISVLFTLSAHKSNSDFSVYLTNSSAIVLSIIGICIIMYISYFNANKLINYLGSQREKIVNSIMAFLIFCVGLEIAVTGILHIIKQI